MAWNPGAERIYGWSEAEALAMNIRDMIPEAERDGALATLDKQCQRGAVEPCRMQRTAKNGTIVEVSVTATTLANSSGESYAIATTERQIA
jgi:two-component system CheB/CheR fusion protein